MILNIVACLVVAIIVFLCGFAVGAGFDSDPIPEAVSCPYSYEVGMRKSDRTVIAHGREIDSNSSYDFIILDSQGSTTFICPISDVLYARRLPPSIMVDSAELESALASIGNDS